MFDISVDGSTFQVIIFKIIHIDVYSKTVYVESVYYIRSI